MRSDELSTQKEESKSTANQLMVQIQELQYKVRSLSDANEFYDPETASSSGSSHVPSQPMRIPSPRGMISRDSCSQHDTRNSWCTSGHAFEGVSAPGEPPAAIFGSSRNMPSASCGHVPLNTGRIAERANELGRNPQNSASLTPRSGRKFSPRNPPSQAEGVHPQSCMVELPRNQVSEMHFDKFPNPATSQCWKTNFKTEESSCSGFLSDAMLWLKEVEMAKSVDDLMTSQSVRGYKFRNFEMLEAKTASALKSIIYALSS